MTTTEAAPATTTHQTTGTFTPARTLSIASLVLAIVSIIAGQAVLLPAAAIVLGVLGYRQEPAGRPFAVWGIIVSAIALFGWLIVGVVGFAVAAPFLAFAWL